jgi:hypothetical protein
MASDDPTSAQDDGRVVSFRRRAGGVRPPPAAPTPVEDLAKYETREGPDDYRNRMLVNVVAFVFVVALIGAGLWVADTMARMRKDQDCVLSGRRGCSPIVTTHERW